MIEQLVGLESLPKRHWHWPYDLAWLKTPEAPEIVAQFVRIMRSGCIVPRWDDEQTIGVVRDAVLANRAAGGDAQLGVNYSAWHYVWTKDDNPGEWNGRATDEAALMVERLDWTRRQLGEAANLVGMVLLDCERFYPGSVHAEHTAAILEKYRLVYAIAKTFFPVADVTWYARGSRWRNGLGWYLDPRFTLEEPGTHFSPPLYWLPDYTRNTELFRVVAEDAIARGQRVMPWIALGAGTAPDPPGRWKWNEMDHDYPITYSYELGREFNHPWWQRTEESVLRARTTPAPWHVAESAAFYPGPLRTPTWLKHFVAYVEGAHNTWKDRAPAAPNSPAAEPVGPAEPDPPSPDVA